MPLTPGVRLGPYEIVAPLGEGGMGQVWRARDTRLDREVAIKTTRGPFNERFEREARAISSLNHPHICTLHDVGEYEGAGYLVMELIDGQPIAGPLPLDRVLTYGAQICAALEAAHRKGIVHRDLKPANILVTKAGVKLLDFGLAKQREGADGPPPSSTDAAITKLLTGEHVIVGTPQYMAPEQIEGKEADARTDIFALGCVLYEALTGRKAFDGKTPSSTMAAILATEPRPMKELKPLTPASFQRVAKRCLAKDPDDRWQSARDLRAELEWMAGDGSSREQTSAPHAKWQRWVSAPSVIAFALAAGALGYGISTLVRRPAPPIPRLTLNLAPPDGTSFDITSVPALSPDGRWIVFRAGSKDGKQRLWLRRLDSSTAQPLNGAELGSFPFWSPDSQHVGFTIGNTLKRADVANGPAMTIAELPAPMRGASWNQSGTIILGLNNTGPILRVADTGGNPSPATTIEQGKPSYGHRHPAFLPDGRHFVYLLFNPVLPEENQLRVGTLDDVTTSGPTIGQAISGAMYASGYLLFLRGSSPRGATLVAQAFSPDTLAFSGEARSVVEDVPISANVGTPGVYSASSTGLLTYLTTGNIDAQSTLTLMDRKGSNLGTLAEKLTRPSDLELAPDGKSLAVTVPDRFGNSQILIYDVSNGIFTTFTSNAAQNQGPIWSHDGREIYWSSLRNSATSGLFRRPVDRSRDEESLNVGRPGPQRPTSVSARRPHDAGQYGGANRGDLCGGAA